MELFFSAINFTSRKRVMSLRVRGVEAGVVDVRGAIMFYNVFKMV